MHVGRPPGILSVYLAQRVGLDILELRSKERHIWVRANLVMRPGGKVIVRPIKIYKLFTMWDYKDKQESQRWT